MAEALLNWRGRGRFQAESAGSRPADRVNAHAIETLREYNIPWSGRAPRSIDGLEREPWDFVVTVCDRAKESCPIFPGKPILAHWHAGPRRGGRRRRHEAGRVQGCVSVVESPDRYAVSAAAREARAALARSPGTSERQRVAQRPPEAYY